MSKLSVFWKRKPKKVRLKDTRKYVLVRADLKPGHQMAQGIHASDYLSAAAPLALYQNPVVSVLAVENEEHLLEMASKHRREVGHPAGWLYREPDLGYEATAFACYSRGYEFADLRLSLS